MENGKMIVDGVYLHINNGGVTFSVTNEDGLALEIEAGHFGNTTNKMKLFVKKDSLRRLGEMLIDASEREGQEIEWLSLECRAIDKETGKTKHFNPDDESCELSSDQTQ